LESQKQVEKSFADCDKASEQVKLAEKFTASELRLRRMKEILLPEIERVAQELAQKKTTLPKNYLKTCLENKVLAFDTHVKNAAGDIVGRPEFNFIIGQRLMMENNYSSAYTFFSRAALVDLTNATYHRKRYDAWILWQASRISHIDKESYYRDVIFHLNPLLELKGAPLADKIEAHIQIARASIILKKFEEVVPHFEAALGYKPTRSDAVLDLANFLLMRGDEKKGLEVLLKYAPKQKIDSIQTTEIFRRLLTILRKNEKYDLAESYLMAAKNLFPKNAEIKSMAQLALAENKKFHLAENLKIQKNIHSLDQRRAEALILENKGDEAQMKNMLGQSLNYYLDSLKLYDNNSNLRLKMSKMIFDAHAESHFNLTNLRVDMDNALSYLQPLYNEKTISSMALSLFIQISSRSSFPELSRKACLRYTKSYGDINSINVAQDCIKMSAPLLASESDKDQKDLERKIEEMKKKPNTDETQNSR
jgi:hypothetical protein